MKNIKMILIVVLFIGFFALLVFVSKVKRHEEYKMYDDTISQLEDVVLRLRREGILPREIRDSWGSGVNIVNEGAKIRLISNGVSSAWTNDDIYVTINTQTWSYNIFYSYKGRSYSSAYFE